MPAVTKLFGPPGTGKTTSLLTIMEQHLAAGVRPDRIGFVSFTTKAATEAKTRAIARFNFHDRDLVYFRTIHSLVFRQLQMKRDSVIQWRHKNELGAMLGMRFEGGRSQAEDGSMYGMSVDDRIAFLESIARAKQCDLRQAWSDANEAEIDYWALDRYARSYRAYKEKRGLVDFNDMLDNFVAHGARLAPSLDVLIVDEAQDLSKAQWAVVRCLMERAGRVYVAGDDDQSIYQWSGADVDSFLSMDGEARVLDQSYRVPPRIHNVALGISSRISKRQEKTWKAKAGDPGSVHFYASSEEVDMSKGQWLLLARNGYLLARLEEHCLRMGYSYRSVGKSPLDGPELKAVIIWERIRKGQGVDLAPLKLVLQFLSERRLAGHHRRGLLSLAESQPITKTDLINHGLRLPPELPIWHEALDLIPEDDKSYFIAARKQGETLTKDPRISISTIHAAKGGEAENVLVLTDISGKTYEQMQNDPDSEHRTFYVGVTRAMQSLHVIEPSTRLGYTI